MWVPRAKRRKGLSQITATGIVVRANPRALFISAAGRLRKQKAPVGLALLPILWAYSRRRRRRHPLPPLASRSPPPNRLAHIPNALPEPLHTNELGSGCGLGLQACRPELGLWRLGVARDRGPESSQIQKVSWPDAHTQKPTKPLDFKPPSAPLSHPTPDPRGCIRCGVRKWWGPGVSGTPRTQTTHEDTILLWMGRPWGKAGKQKHTKNF